MATFPQVVCQVAGHRAPVRRDEQVPVFLTPLQNQTITRTLGRRLTGADAFHAPIWDMTPQLRGNFHIDVFIG